MNRLLVFLALALAPLLASAHQGHHAPAHESAAPPVSATPDVAIVAAPSRCPGGGHEDCCCHDGWCSTGSATLAVADAPSREVQPVAAEAKVAFIADPALPSAALLRFPARGPPPVS